MHISEGVLSAPLLAGGAIVAIAGVSAGLRSLKPEEVAKTAVLSSAFFVASLIHIPVGPTSAHLLLNGIMGVMLGWAAFPALLVALFLQAMFFQFGGITVLGVNTLIFAIPAVLSYYLFDLASRYRPSLVIPAAFLCGFLAVFFSALLLALALVATSESFWMVARVALAAHLPVMVIEGGITALFVGFLKKVQPELLPGYAT